MTTRLSFWVCWATSALAAGLSSAAPPLIITSGPTITPAVDAPLARVLEISTNRASRVSVVATSMNGGWAKDFEGYFTHHSVPLLGFKPDLAYDLEITVYDSQGVGVQAPVEIVTTDPLPADFPPIVTTVSMPGLMEEGYTLFGVRNRNGPDRAYTVILDATGDVVWYRDFSVAEIRQLPNGHLLHLGSVGADESDLLGQDLRHWHPAGAADPPAGSILVDSPTHHPVLLHHEVFPTARGTILSADRTFPIVEDYPTSETDPKAPTATVAVRDEPVLEFEAGSGEIVGYWSLHDLLDPRRIGYDSVGSEGCFPDCPNDWGHVNAVVDDPGDPDDPNDDAVVVSLRHQDAVVKFSRVTGDLIWILGTHENWSAAFQPFLLTPVGEPFEWQYHQHAPMVTPEGTLLLFDNGNYRASPFDGVVPVPSEDNHSRAVEFAIDEENMTVQQVWESGGTQGETWYAWFISDADRLANTGNTLITFGGIIFIDHMSTGGETVRIVEVDHGTPAQPVFQVEIADPDPGEGYTVYRSERIRDMYPPPPAVVFADGFESGDTSAWSTTVP